jgi:3-hydroxyisobutyrate dehydrogenase-like beta-hydroxyacid dehydrogenase
MTNTLPFASLEGLAREKFFKTFPGYPMANLGFVGLGVMGSRMVKRLLDAGHSVTGYNRTKSKAEWLLDAGMKWAESPRAAAQSSDVVFSMIANNTALRAVTEGNDGIIAGLSPGKIYVEMSTVSPAAIRELARQIEAKGAEMLDAPVSGSSITLEEGKLSFMVGGKRETFEKVLPYLQAIGPKATYVGGHGLAASMKVATNLSLAVQMLSFSEGLLLAEKSGIERATAVEVLLNSVMASPMVKYRGPFVLKMPDEAIFDVNMMQKDLLLALEMGRQLDVPLPTTAITNEILTAARGMGLAKKDFAILFEALARMAGMGK